MSVDYFGDVLSDHVNGCRMSLGLKLAVEFLKGGAVPLTDNDANMLRPGDAARYALDLAGELLGEAAARGMVTSMPIGTDPPPETVRHIERQVRVQMAQHLVSQRVQREDAPVIQPGSGRIL